ncbi:MAG: hypothetical protein P8Q52_01540, partial [Acidimicrobiales bacterium]|nr:hypothetical protein [Acidimicrobiales bacterium]
PGAIDEDLGGQSACKIPGAKSATVSVIATDPESGIVSASVTVTWTVRRDGDPTVLDSGSSEVSDLGGDAYEATIGPFGDILPGYGADGRITVIMEATNGAGLSAIAWLDLTIRDCS